MATYNYTEQKHPGYKKGKANCSQKQQLSEYIALATHSTKTSEAKKIIYNSK